MPVHPDGRGIDLGFEDATTAGQGGLETSDPRHADGSASAMVAAVRTNFERDRAEFDALVRGIPILPTLAEALDNAWKGVTR